MPVFRGSRHQRGHGLGSVLSGLFRRFVIPFFRDHGRTLASNALKTGVDVAEDVLDGRSLKEFAKKRLLEGIKRTAQSLIHQSGSSVGRRGRKRRKIRANTKDIRMMAFAHDMSCECSKSELDLFAVPPIQTG